MRTRNVAQFLILAAGLYGGLCLLVYALQAHLLFVRGGGVPRRTPAAIGIPFEEVWLETSDGVRLHSWWLHPAAAAGGGRPAIVLCHGNAGTIENRLEVARVFHEMGLSVLLFDYRGYGLSDGSPGEEGTYLDAEAAFDAVRARGVAAERIVVYGESLGGAVAVELCRRRPAAALITEATFTSVPAMASKTYPWLPVRWLCRYRYDSLSKVAHLALPKLLLHSPEDHLVPFAHAEQLAAVASEPRELIRTEGGHNDGGFLRRREWITQVAAFVQQALPPEE